MQKKNIFRSATLVIFFLGDNPYLQRNKQLTTERGKRYASGYVFDKYQSYKTIEKKGAQ